MQHIGNDNPRASRCRRVSNKAKVADVPMKQTWQHKLPIGKHTGIYKLHLQARATLNTGAVRQAVRCPEGADKRVWLAAQMLCIYQEADMMVEMLVGGMCTSASCPIMCAGEYLQFLWSDESTPKPMKLSAPDYMRRLISYTEGVLGDPAIFPPDDVSFPQDFEQVLNTLLKRIFRIYSHVYLCHFEAAERNSAEAHLNCCFKHILFFVKEFGLLEPRDLEPMHQLAQIFEEAADAADS